MGLHRAAEWRIAISLSFARAGHAAVTLAVSAFRHMMMILSFPSRAESSQESFQSLVAAKLRLAFRDAQHDTPHHASADAAALQDCFFCAPVLAERHNEFI